MKHIITLTFYIISFSLFSQNWKLNNIDKTKEYSFQYIFSLQNEDDNNEIKIITVENSKKTELSGQILDKLNNPMSGASIKIISQDSTLRKELQADFDGNIKVELPSGEYSIEINYIGFDQFKTEIKIKEDSTTDFKIKLGLGQESQIYQIDSKTELTENKISEVIECVNERRKAKSYSTIECSEKNKYKVTIQI